MVSERLNSMKVLRDEVQRCLDVNPTDYSQDHAGAMVALTKLEAELVSTLHEVRESIKACANIIEVLKHDARHCG